MIPVTTFEGRVPRWGGPTDSFGVLVSAVTRGLPIASDAAGVRRSAAFLQTNWVRYGSGPVVRRSDHGPWLHGSLHRRTRPVVQFTSIESGREDSGGVTTDETTS